MLNRKSLSTGMIVAGLVFCFQAMGQTKQNPDQKRVNEARASGYCADPWITVAVWDRWAGTRAPYGVANLGECNPQLYNGGSWSNYDQLYRAYESTVSSLPPRTFSLVDNRNNTLTVTVDAGGGFLAWTQVAGRIVAQGGGNIVAQGGGNIVAQGGGNIVAQGGGNYKVLSAEQKALTLPNGRVLIITRAPAPPPR